MMDYLEEFIRLTKKPENCESDNWTDACNFVGKMATEIKQLKSALIEMQEFGCVMVRECHSMCRVVEDRAAMAKKIEWLKQEIASRNDNTNAILMDYIGLKKAITSMVSAAGLPDSGWACRVVIQTGLEALKESEAK